MSRLITCVFVLAVSLSGRPRPVAERSVVDHFRALPLDKQKLTGLLGSRIRANSDGFLESLTIAADLSRIDSTSSQSNESTREFAGLYLDAAADAYEYNHDLQLRAEMGKVAVSLASPIAASPPTPGTALSEPSLYGVRSSLIGLLAHHRVTTERASLTAAQHLGLAVTRWLSGDALTGLNGETTPLVVSLIDPLADLYRLTGDRRFLVFCRNTARLQSVPAPRSPLSATALTNTLLAYTALANLWEVTADSTNLRTAQRVWQQFAAAQLSVTGALVPSINLTNDAAGEADSCITAAWMQFTFRLLRVTGENKYGDELERTVFNQLLAAQDVRNGALNPSVPLDGSKTFNTNLNVQGGRCMLREAKALASIPHLVWGLSESGIAVNLYTPGRAFFTVRKHGVIQIYAEGSFPETGQLQFHVEPARKGAIHFPLRLRVPYWSENFQVDVAGLHLSGLPGNVVIIDRDWKNGDTVKVAMALPLRTVHLSPADPNSLVLQRGPQVLVLGKTLNPDIEDLQTAGPLSVEGNHYRIFNYADSLLPRSWAGDQVYRISGQIGGKPHDLLLVPFADALSYRTTLRAQPK